MSGSGSAPAAGEVSIPLPPPGTVLLAERPTEPIDRQELASLIESAPAAPAEPPTAPAQGSRMSRKALRAQAAAERRRNALWGSAKIAGPVVLAVLLIIALVAVLGSRGSGPTTDGAVARTQQTMLLQVSGPGSVATANVLLGRSTTSASAAGVLIPSDLVTDVPSVGAVPFGETARIADPTSAGNALSDQLGVIVDATWRVNADGLAALVDAVGGVSISVASDVADAKGAVVVAAGPDQLLDGRSAAAYAAFRGARDQEQTRAARFSDVLTAWLKALPTDPAQLEKIVQAPSRSGTSTWSAAQVAGFFAGAAASARADDLLLTNLPVKVIDTGSATPSFRLDREAANALVAQAFSDSVPQGRSGANVRVLVQNGVGTPGLGDAARSKLVKAGYVFVNGGNAAKFGRATTTVVVPDETSASLRRGAEVAQSLGLPTSAVQVSGQGQSVADLVVILGKDFSAGS